MDDIQFAFTASDKIGRLYRDAKLFSVDTPVLTLPYLRGLASAFCDTLDRDFAASDLLEGKIKSLDNRGLLRPAVRRNLRTLQRSGNIAAHPESYTFETHDFHALAGEALVAARGLIEQLYALRNEPIPWYEVAEVGDSGLRSMCYQAMVEGDIESVHQAGKYFKAKADNLNKGESLLLSNGYGIPAKPHIEQAMFWFQRGAAVYQPDCMYQYGAYLVADRMSDDERRAEGERLIDRAAQAGHADAQVYVADSLMFGSGIFTEDHQAGREMYELAADQGHPAAFSQLGIIYDQGIGCKPDAAAAARYTMRAAEAGYPQGQFNLFRLYYYGSGVEQNLDEALKWLAEAAEQDYPQALYSQALIILEGKISGSGDAEALELLNRAVSFPEVQAQAGLSIAEITLRSENSLPGWLKALANLQFCYESLSKIGDPDAITAECLSLSAEVVSKVRSHIVENGPDPELKGSDILTCTLFDADGVPSTDRFGRHTDLAEALFTMGSDNPIAKAKAVDLLMREACIAPKAPSIALRPQAAPLRISQVVVGDKPGRNDLCHCGSGKKFKKCHGR